MNVTKQDAIQEFQALVSQGIEAWLKAGQIVAAQIDEDPAWLDKCSTRTRLSSETILAFDQIGRRKLHPRLMVSDAPGVVALRRLPYSVQEKHIAEPVELLVSSDGKWETLLVDVHNLTRLQAKQVFDKDKVRSSAAQRAWIEGETLKRTVPEVPDQCPYRIVKRTLVIQEPCQLTARDLARLLADMEQ